MADEQPKQPDPVPLTNKEIRHQMVETLVSQEIKRHVAKAREKLQIIIDAQTAKIAERDATIAKLERERDAEIAHRDAIIANLERDKERQGQSLNEHMEQIHDFREEGKRYRREISNLHNQLADQNQLNNDVKYKPVKNEPEVIINNAGDVLNTDDASNDSDVIYVSGSEN